MTLLLRGCHGGDQSLQEQELCLGEGGGGGGGLSRDKEEGTSSVCWVEGCFLEEVTMRWALKDV